jgi:hypothetical protein
MVVAEGEEGLLCISCRRFNQDKASPTAVSVREFENYPLYGNVILGYIGHCLSVEPIPSEKKKLFILKRKEKKNGRRKKGCLGRDAMA